MATATPTGDVLIRVRGLKKYFPVTRGILFQTKVGEIKAVDDVSFDIIRGKTLGLVGESGCGKITTGRCILQVINLLQELQEQFNLTYLFTAHDLSVVRPISDRVAVMYLGNIVELTDRESLHQDPLHP